MAPTSPYDMRKLGFDDRKSAVTQFKELLATSNIEDILHTIKTLTLATFNIHEQGQFQLSSWTEIGNQLKTLFPGVFDTKKRLAFARQVALHYHRAARSRRNTGSSSGSSGSRPRRCVRRAATASTTTSTASGPQNGSCSNSGQPMSRPSQFRFIPMLGNETMPSRVLRSQQRAERSTVHVDDSRRCQDSEPRQLDERSPPRKRLERSNTNIAKPSTLPPPPPSTSQDFQAQPACHETDASNLNTWHVPSDGPTTTTTTTPSRTFSVNSSTPNPSSIAHIRHFLQSCSPSLDHLLFRFIEIGFQSPALVREVACTWTSDERRELMKRLGYLPNGRQITELELVALERGFRALHSPGISMTSI